MPAFAWRNEPTRHFGEQPVPFASVGIKDPHERWRTFSLLVDSGAVISLLCRSVGELLRVPIESGERITVTGVGRKQNEVFVHKLAARIGDGPERPVRFAISTSEDVPNLLGRLDIFDRWQVGFDPSLQETVVSAPWLDAKGRMMWRHVLETEAAILSRWKEHPLPAPADEAARRFVNRADQLVGAAAGLLKLHRDFELPLLIRSFFELSVQFEYLMHEAESRARLYLDFEHVTRHRVGQAWLNLPGPIGEGLRRSRKPGDGEAGNRARYEVVRSRYAGKRDPERIRSHWYPGTLRDIANDVGRKAEYDAVYGLYSAWAHGDPWTSQLPEVAHGGLVHAFTYWARLLVQVADAKRIILSGEAYQSLVVLAKGLDRE